MSHFLPNSAQNLTDRRRNTARGPAGVPTWSTSGVCQSLFVFCCRRRLPVSQSRARNSLCHAGLDASGHGADVAFPSGGGGEKAAPISIM